MKFNSYKAAEASAFILELHGNPMKYTDLLRILYAADFKALTTTGQVISGTSVNLSSPWLKIIQTKEETQVALLYGIGKENLSEEEETILKDSYTDYMNNTEAFSSFIGETSTKNITNRKPKVSTLDFYKNYSKKVKL